MKVEFNTDPINKCLFSGRVGSRYHLRNYLLKQVLKDKELQELMAVCYDTRAEKIGDFSTKEAKHYFKLDFINKEQVIKDDYIKLINSYRSAFVGSTFRKHLLGKYFEYCAGGALLLADRTNDSDLAGFKPYEHYIPVQTENIEYIINRVNKVEPEEFDQVRKNGYEFVREHHNINRRFQQLCGYLQGVVDGEFDR